MNSLDGDRRGTRQSQYSDAHQLFLGNLPHNASEDDLRQVFESYGRVVELRIHSKSNDRCKGPQGNNTGKVPNYGFITFEDQQVVSKVLQNLVSVLLTHIPELLIYKKIHGNLIDFFNCSRSIILLKMGRN